MGRIVMRLAAAVLLGTLAVADVAAAPPPLSIYGNLPGFEGAAMSPSGTAVALVGMSDGKRQLLILDKNREVQRAVAVPVDTKMRSLTWAGDDLVLMLTSATVGLGPGFTTNKAELNSMIVVPVANERPWVVFANNSMIQGGVSGFYGVNAHDGQWYGYFGGMTADTGMSIEATLNRTDPILYEVDLQSRKSRKIADRSADQSIYREWLVGTDGKVAATLNFESSGGKWRIGTPSVSTIASGRQLLGGIDLVGFGSSPGTLIYTADDPGFGTTRWFETPLAGGAGKEIMGDANVADALFDVRTHQLIGYRVAADTPTYRFFDPRHGKVVAAVQKAFAGSRVILVDWNDRFDRLLVEVDGAHDPQSWWLIDIKTGHADQIGTSYAVADGDIGPVRMVHYKAGDGTPIDAVLTLPPGKGERGLPVVVFPHGGPAAHDEAEFDWWAQAFASRGYAVLQPNFRGSTGHGAAFEKAGHSEWGRNMQTDVSDGLAYLAKEGIADPTRACIMGASYGGYVALAGVTLQHGLYRCAVSVAGVSDVGKMVATDMSESGDNATMWRSLKEEVGSGRDLALVSPIKFAARADAPVLLIHGKDDTVVAFDQSSSMAAALRHAGKPVEFVTLAQTDHWLTRSDTRLAMLEAAVAFVEKHNPAGGK